MTEFIGKQFTRLMPYRRVRNDKNGNMQWRCVCTCGNRLSVTSAGLTSKNIQSCGCLRRDKNSRRMLSKLTNRRFGRLTVIAGCGRNNRQDALWRCRCGCGNEIVVRTNSLTSHHTRSCGCRKIDVARKRALYNAKTMRYVSKSELLFLDAIERIYGIVIQRQTQLFGRVYDGRYNRILFEIDSDYWHRNKQDVDRMKDELALKHGFCIVRIVIDNSRCVSRALIELKPSLIKLFLLQHFERARK